MENEHRDSYTNEEIQKNPEGQYETLAGLNTGEIGEVICISASCTGLQRRRLMDLGVVPGSRIKAEFKSIGGNPVAYNIRGALIALRKDHSSGIFIRKIGKEDQDGNE